MGIQRRLSQIGFAFQTGGQGVPVATATHGFGLSEGTVVDVDPDESPIDLTWTTRVTEGFDRKAVKPKVTFGSVATPLLVDSLLRAVLGTWVTTGSAAPYTHVITPAADVAYLSVWGLLGTTSLFLSDGKLDELELSFDGAGRVMVKGSIMACGVSAGAFSLGGFERVSGGFLAAAGGTFLIDGVAAKVQSGSVKISNHCSYVPVANSVLPSDVFPGVLEVTYSLKVVPDDVSIWSKIAFGNSAGSGNVAVSPYFGPMSLKWVMDANTDLVVAAPLTRFASKFPDSNPAGGPAEITVEGKVVAPVSGATVTATIRDTQST